MHILIRLAGTSALFFVAYGAAAKDPVWLELGPGGQVLARAVVKSACPQISIDGKRSAMPPRVAPDGSPGKPPPDQWLVCEKDVTGAKKVSIGEVKLRMPPKNPQRILVIGDTGCRIKVEAKQGDHGGEKEQVQDCNDPKQWPFKAVAKAAAAANPDLVIHVGDYVYREAACPADKTKDCGGTPWGDNWKTWDADFFTPARPLLAAAPWIMVRGNHESCSRQGKGWTYYLDPSPYAKTNQCSDNSAPYAVKAGEFQAVVMDTSNAPDSGATPAQIADYAKQFGAAAAFKLDNAWFLSHRPIWAAIGDDKHPGNLIPLNATLQSAWQTTPIPGVTLIVAGHIHLFELLGFKEALPPQLVVGNGGTDPDHKIKTPLDGKTIGPVTIANGTSVHDFGFALMKPTADGKGWTLHLHDSKTKKKLTCSLQGNTTECKTK
jgi:predicted phosphodiesterase